MLPTKSYTDRYRDEVVDLSIENGDPYFFWALANEGRRLGNVMPSTSVARGQSVKVEKYVQVLIEIWEQSLVTDDKRQEREDRKAAFWKFVKERNLVWVRGAYSRADRFVTGIVPDFHLIEFLQEIPAVSSRFELGHAFGEAEQLRCDNTDATAGEALTFADEEQRGHASPELLTGNVMVIIDYGCPFAHAQFRAAIDPCRPGSPQTTRIRYVWFQDANAVRKRSMLPRTRSENGRILFPYGRELTGAAIDAMLAANSNALGEVDESACYDSIGYDLMQQSVTHGGHVMDVACGSPNPLATDAVEVWLAGTRIGPPAHATAHDKAGEAKIVFVELPRSAVGDSSGAGMNVYLVDALQYAMKRIAPDAKVVINCSFGTNAGPHEGSSMLEEAVTSIVQSQNGFNVNFVLPAGNSFNSGCHATGAVKRGAPLELTFDVAADKPTDTFLEVWYQGQSPLMVDCAPAHSSFLAPSVGKNAVQTWAHPWTPSVPMCTVVHTANATSTSHLMLIVIAPTRPRDAALPEAPYGHWRIKISSEAETETQLDAWIERDDPIFEPPGDRQTRFVTESQLDDQDEYATPTVTKFGTLNSYASAQAVHAVGAAIVPTQRFAAGNGNGAEPEMSRYSSAGSDGLRTSLNQPYFVAYADDSLVLPGRIAAGSRSRATARYNGTSVASPQAARDILNAAGPYGSAIPFRPGMGGARGDGLSLQGEYAQLTRAGLGLLVP